MRHRPSRRAGAPPFTFLEKRKSSHAGHKGARRGLSVAGHENAREAAASRARVGPGAARAETPVTSS